MGGISHVLFNMVQRIAPNNNLPATHFIDIFKTPSGIRKQDKRPISFNKLEPFGLNYKGDCIPIAIFRIRENKLPTLHNFNK